MPGMGSRWWARNILRMTFRISGCARVEIAGGASPPFRDTRPLLQGNAITCSSRPPSGSGIPQHFANLPQVPDDPLLVDRSPVMNAVMPGVVARAFLLFELADDIQVG
ncbi:hypothetical protein D3C85_1692690 [compost metagenome]